MTAEPKVASLNRNTDIYGIWDERGRLIGTGTREVCEVLLYLITQPPHSTAAKIEVVPRQTNVRAAMSI